MKYTIILTEAEDLAFKCSIGNPQEWIDNAVMNRTRIAIDEICDLYFKAKLENNQLITTTNKSDMIFAAYEEGIIQKSENNLKLSTGISTT